MTSPKPTWFPRLKGLLLHALLTAALLSGLCSAEAQQTATFNDYLIHAVRRMPRDGGYSTGSLAAENLATKGIVWNERRQRLDISPSRAKPSFCSSACYLVLLSALQHCEKRGAIPPLPPAAWKSMAVLPGQKDGEGVWGRANANGPGMAKLVADLKAGVNFEDIRYARPGDFMKIFWNEHIGKREAGHLVVFLRTFKTPDGKDAVEFWSSNSGAGYSVKAIELASVKRAIFTRILYPARFAGAHTLTPMDTWLHSLLNEPVSYREVRKKCHIR